MASLRSRSWFLLIGFLMFSSGLAALIALTYGATHISMNEIIHTLLNGQGTPAHSILYKIRLPRIILGFSVGGALSLSGVILQGVFRNPLVEPYTLGISGGASLGVCLAIVLNLTTATGIIAYPIMGFFGALLTIFIVYSINARRGALKVQGMLLSGVMISFISSSIVMLLIALSTTEDLRNIIFWIMGSLDEPNELLIYSSVFCSIAGLLVAYIYSVELNALSLGEEEAFSLGINTERTKKVLFVVASLLSGLSVAVTGIIGFVGLVIPHLMRMYTGNDHRILIVSSFLGGGLFLIICDTFARTIIAPLELPVGVITGIVGGSLFIYALNKRSLNL